jgi:hypothetical protein
MALGLRIEPVAGGAVGGDRDLQVRPGLGDLGGRLDAGETAADHQHGPARGQIAQAFAQPQRGRLAREVVRVLGHTGHTVVGRRAAEGVHKGVVGNFVPALQRHHFAVGVDGGDTS